MARDLRTAHWHQMRQMRLGIARSATQAFGYTRLAISFAPRRRHHILQLQTQARGPGPTLQPKTSSFRAFSCDTFCPPNLLAVARTHPDRCTYQYRLYATNFSLATLPPPPSGSDTHPSMEGCLFRALKN